eukprot:TRINITY_DN13546_c0_g1_i2.p1 TRINITY_DN13546_c0_g1~~TRINITY_DN13546_c0_g1_i2.p1  ORF type:complete len:208 (+),score=59.28 TRINITY_DN13546_c0_g1_i2:393-1016(+)
MDFVIAFDPGVRQTKTTGKFSDLAGLQRCITTMGCEGGRWADMLEIVRLAQTERMNAIITEMLSFGHATLLVQSATGAVVQGHSRLTKIGGSRRLGQSTGSRVLLYCDDTDAPLGMWKVSRQEGACCLVAVEGAAGAPSFPADWVGTRRGVRWEQVQHLRISGVEGEDAPHVLLLRTGHHYKLIVNKAKLATRWRDLPQSVRELEFH